MIHYVSPESRPQILEMWKICFGDSEPYFSIYFREKYRDNNTLAYFVGDRIVASLQLLSYNFTYCGEEIPVAYISGACTLPDERKKGYMAALLKHSFGEMAKREIPLSVLVPEEARLLHFYKKYGYAQTFDSGADVVSLDKLIEQHTNDLHSAYKQFDSLFREKEMVVQKTFEDFRVIVEEAAGYDFPPKKSLIGMSRIIDAKLMLSLFAKRYPHKTFSIEVSDDILAENNLFLIIENGAISSSNKKHSVHIQLNVSDLAQALLGYHTSDKNALFKDIFPEHKPQMHYMLE